MCKIHKSTNWADLDNLKLVSISRSIATDQNPKTISL